MKKLLTILSLMFTLITHADEVALTMSMGQGYTNNLYSGLYNIGVENYFEKNYLYKFELGVWTDTELNHSTGFYSSVLFGRRFGDYTKFNATVLVGALIISAPDALLSSPIQFTEDVSIGYKQTQCGIKHVSNAGLRLPNVGRDYVYCRYIIPLN